MSVCNLSKIDFRKAKHRISLQQKTEVNTDLGSVSSSWSEIASMYAIIRPMSQNERLRYDKLDSRVTHKITVRYQSLFSTPLNSVMHRIIFNGRQFEIYSAINLYEENRYIEIMAHEVHQKAISDVAFKVEGDAKYNIQTGSRSGKSYRRGNVTHNASAPGEFPKTDTGELVANINTIFAMNRLEATVGSRKSAPHGYYLEFGTSRMAPRPWLMPTLLQNKGYISDRFHKALLRMYGKNI